MSVLLSIAKWMAGVIIPPLVQKLISALSEWVRLTLAKREIEKKNKEVREKTENAQTPQEREDALKNIADRFKS